MQQSINIPETLQAQFLATCAEANIDGEQAIKELMEEFMADVALNKDLIERDKTYEAGRTLDQMIEDYGLDV